ncbi:unnamed protein product [Rotaria sp. Silwood2]|nr:unnamed protein product [Rotaria sp. Silwood2]CAF3148768.1 unnamed protein product [Rotaria sp. Silwood2]CAF3429775.1 unnamed protein product [Rotaria sp. Silwood2]CAF3939798.1 unnamed protein product [Rotaria sp. Silwood2]CAF4670056.1 unnamed protein product [Rotaria sp. Silwood2]
MFRLEPVIPRNGGQTREKIDRIYWMLQDWYSCLTNKPEQQTTTENFSSISLSVSEVEDFMHRLRYLFVKSNYHEQILLMQICPVEWGWKKIQRFFCCTFHQAYAVVSQRTEHGDLSKPVDSRGNNSFDSNVAQVIQDFYLDDEISRQSSSAKDTRTSKDLGTDFVISDGALSQYKNNNNMMNLSLHQQDFSIKAVWTFTSSGHGKSPCDGLGAVVKSAARKYLLKRDPEVAFCSAKDFYQFTLENTSRTLSSTSTAPSSKPNKMTIDADNNDSTDEGNDMIVSRSIRSIEVRWLDEKEVEDTFRKVLKARRSKLSTKGNAFILSKSSIFLSDADRIVGIRSFHEFDATFTGTVVCRSVSTSIDSKAFQFKLNFDLRSPITRVLDSKDFINGKFLIIEHDDILHLAQITTADLRKSQLTITFFLPPLPARKFSSSKSEPLIVSTTKVIDLLVDSPKTTTTKTIMLSDEQFVSIQDLREEF